MTSAFKDLLSRNFAVGFLLPSLGMVFGTIWLVDAHQLLSIGDLWGLSPQNPLIATLLLPAAVWFAAITLEAFNYQLIRLAEGYGYTVPLSWFFFTYAAIWLLDLLLDRWLNLALLGTLANATGWDRWTVALLAPALVWSVLAIAVWIGVAQKGAKAVAKAFWKLLGNFGLTKESKPPHVSTLNPFFIRQRRIHRRLMEDLRSVQENIKNGRGLKEAENDDLKALEEDLKEAIAIRFPYDRNCVLPTTFGNIMRAAELYPHEMYNFEAIHGWSRLLAVIPADYREFIDRAKADMDFLVNVWALSWMFLLGYFGLCQYTGRPVELWVPILAYISVRVSWFFSWDAAGRWGGAIRGAADVFLPDLWWRLGLDPTASREQREEIWGSLLEAWTFSDPAQLPNCMDRSRMSRPRQRQETKTTLV